MTQRRRRGDRVEGEVSGLWTLRGADAEAGGGVGQWAAPGTCEEAGAAVLRGRAEQAEGAGLHIPHCTVGGLSSLTRGEQSKAPGERWTARHPCPGYRG